MAYFFLTTVVQYISWIRQILGDLAHEFSMSAERFPRRFLSAVDWRTSKFMLPRSLTTYSIKAIWEARTFTAATLLGFIAIFIIYYSHRPWRKLPPSPRGLPIIGNVLQVMDTKWLVSKDCKERFGEDEPIYLIGLVLSYIHGNYRRCDVSRCGWTAYHRS